MATKNINAEKIQGNLAITSVSATTYQNLPSDIRTTGATYSNNTFTFTNNTGGTYNVLFNTVSGLTINGNITVTGSTLFGSVSATTYQGLPTDIRVTGGTYSSPSSTITFTNNTGGTCSVTGITASSSGTFTGGTVTGPTIFTAGVSANTISATTYQNLPISGLTAGANIGITGSNGNYTISFTGTTGNGTFTGGTVSGATTFTNGLSANTISATTYQNLPLTLTGASSSSNLFTFTNSTGGTFNVTSIATDIIWSSLGDLVYGTGSDTSKILSGNTSSTRKFLISQGSAGVAQAPIWGTIQSSDLPGLILYQNLSIPSSGGTFTPTPIGYRETICSVSGLSATLTVAAPPAASYVDGDRLIFRILDNGTLRTLSFSSAAGGYIQRGASVPTSTITINKISTTTFLYNSLANKWDCVGYVIEF